MVKSLVKILFGCGFLVTLCISIALPQQFAEDLHSYANPDKVRVNHVALDWRISFEEKRINGSVTLTLERYDKKSPLILDTRELTIERVELSADSVKFKPGKFELGQSDKILGAPLKVQLEDDTKFVRIFYSTSPQASGLQWLSPEQTAGKRLPFMYSQAQAIHARSFVP
ncbi:MAG: hypothetical protein D6735_01130, partial [Acidobacteria bacterium]